VNPATSKLDFEGRVVLVTGAGSGLGRAYARELARRGARVVVNNRLRDGLEKADDVVREIRSEGGTAVANHDTVATADGGAGAVRTALDEYGRLDALVHNAGGVRDRTLARLSPDELHEVLDAHLLGAFHLAQPAFRAMKQQGYGRFVFVSSSGGIFGNFGQSNYAAAKMGVLGLSGVVALEGARHGIRSNVVAPLARTGPAAETLGELARLLDPELVAPLVTYLASEQCSETHEVFSAGGGHFARIFVGLAPGWTAPAGEPLTAELVRQHMAQIRDVTGATIPLSLADELAVLAERLRV